MDLDVVHLAWVTVLEDTVKHVLSCGSLKNNHRKVSTSGGSSLFRMLVSLDGL